MTQWPSNVEYGALAATCQIGNEGAHSFALERFVALIPGPYVVVVGPMAKLLPRMLFIMVEREGIRHRAAQFLITYVPAVSYAAKSGED